MDANSCPTLAKSPQSFRKPLHRCQLFPASVASREIWCSWRLQLARSCSFTRLHVSLRRLAGLS